MSDATYVVIDNSCWGGEPDVVGPFATLEEANDFYHQMPEWVQGDAFNVIVGDAVAVSPSDILRRWDDLDRCLDCRVHTYYDYWVADTAWKAAGMEPDGGRLCIDCLETRLGRPLVPSDFPDVPCNEPGRMGEDPPKLVRLKAAASGLTTDTSMLTSDM